MFKKTKEIKKLKGFPGVLNASRRVIKSMQAKANVKRKLHEKLADGLTKVFGSMTFLILNLLWFTVWILINMSMIPNMAAFDPFPFGLLTMIVSLEAIFLSIFVLISQNRQSKVEDLREEVDLQVDIITEQEVTKLLRLLTLFLSKQNIINVDQDKELSSMLRKTNMEKIEASLEKEFEIFDD